MKTILNTSSDSNLYFIADMGANHCNDFKTAKQIIIEAKKAGVDGIKIQTFKPEHLTIPSDTEDKEIIKKWGYKNLWDLYADIALPWEWIKPLNDFAKEIGIELFSSVFHPDAVKFLEREIDPPYYKISSYEITDRYTIEACIDTGKPLIVSLGQLTDEDDDEDDCKSSGVKDYLYKLANRIPTIYLHCISDYPAEFDNLNLHIIKRLNNIGLSAGLSSHCINNLLTTTLLSLGLGAKVFEFHLKAHNQNKTPDTPFSIYALQAEVMINYAHESEKALGDGLYPNKKFPYRKSLFAKVDIQPGERLTKDNTIYLRNDSGIIDYEPNTIATREIKALTPITANLIK